MGLDPLSTFNITPLQDLLNLVASKHRSEVLELRERVNNVAQGRFENSDLANYLAQDL